MCQQESVQGAFRDPHEDDDWLPISFRHSYQERFNHQEQVCSLRNAFVPSHFLLSPFCCWCICLLHCKDCAWCNLERNQFKTTYQILTQPALDIATEKPLQADEHTTFKMTYWWQLSIGNEEMCAVWFSKEKYLLIYLMAGNICEIHK